MKTNVQTLRLLVLAALVPLSSPWGRCSTMTSPLTVTVSPANSATLLPQLNGKSLVDYQYYDITAVLPSGLLLSNWVGGIQGQSNLFVYGWSPHLRFYMLPNLFLQANVITNPFPSFQGSYYGIFSSDTITTTGSAGFNLTTVDKFGDFSGYLLRANQRLSYHGRFTADGSGSASIPQAGSNNDVFVYLSLPLGNPTSDQLTGSIGFQGSSETSPLQAYRKPLYSGTQISPYTGLYTYFGLPEDPGCCSPTNPGSFAFGTVNVNSKGIANWAFTLGDGSQRTWSAPVSWDGYAPLFGAPYGRNGVFGALLQFGPSPDWKTNLFPVVGTNAAASNAIAQATLDLGGEAYWLKLPTPGSFYSDGFKQEVRFFGTAYQPSALAMPATDYDLDFKCGHLGTNRFGNFSWSTENTLGTFSPSDWDLKFDFTPASGRFSGSANFDAPWLKGQALKFNGILLQGFGASVGQFKGTNVFGEVIAVPHAWRFQF